MSSVVNLPGTHSAPAPLSPSLSTASSPSSPVASPASLSAAHDGQSTQPVPPAQGERDARTRTQSHAPGYASSRNPLRTQVQAPAVGAEATSRSAFVPLLLGGLAVLGWLGFQVWQFNVERQALQAAYASQQQTVDGAAKLRASLDTLAADTQRLADAGNPNARTLVEELKKRGVTINTTPANTTPSSAAPAAPAAR